MTTSIMMSLGEGNAPGSRIVPHLHGGKLALHIPRAHGIA